MAGLTVDAKDLAEARAGLKGAARDLGREQRRANKEVAEVVAARARTRAATGSRAEARFAGAIGGRSTQKVARIAVSSRGRNAGAAATFFGAKPLTRHGWNAGRRRGANQRPQYPAWVGNTWTPGVPGQGPYVLNPTLAAVMPEVENLYAEAHARAIARAIGGTT